MYELIVFGRLHTSTAFINKDFTRSNTWLDVPHVLFLISTDLVPQQPQHQKTNTPKVLEAIDVSQSPTSGFQGER